MWRSLPDYASYLVDIVQICFFGSGDALKIVVDHYQVSFFDVCQFMDYYSVIIIYCVLRCSLFLLMLVRSNFEVFKLPCYIIRHVLCLFTNRVRQWKPPRSSGSSSLELCRSSKLWILPPCRNMLPRWSDGQVTIAEGLNFGIM